METNLIHYIGLGWKIRFESGGSAKLIMCIFVHPNRQKSYIGTGHTMIEAFSEAEMQSFGPRKEKVTTLIDTAKLERIEAELHKRQAHPFFDYSVTRGAREQLDIKETPAGDGWMPNIHISDGFERFEFHEEAYWMREKP